MMPQGDGELAFARQRLSEAFEDVLRLQALHRIRTAYNQGVKAGRELAAIEADSITYRRGYLAGYAAGKRGAPAHPDGAPHSVGGRPRRLTA